MRCDDFLAPHTARASSSAIAGPTNRLWPAAYDKLTAKFGESQVFMDVDSIDLGLDFVHVLERTLADCKALVVVIGQGLVERT